MGDKEWIKKIFGCVYLLRQEAHRTDDTYTNVRCSDRLFRHHQMSLWSQWGLNSITLKTEKKFSTSTIEYFGWSHVRHVSTSPPPRINLNLPNAWGSCILYHLYVKWQKSYCKRIENFTYKGRIQEHPTFINGFNVKKKRARRARVNVCNGVMQPDESIVSRCRRSCNFASKASFTLLSARNICMISGISLLGK